MLYNYNVSILVDDAQQVPFANFEILNLSSGTWYLKEPGITRPITQLSRHFDGQGKLVAIPTICFINRPEIHSRQGTPEIMDD